MSIEVIKSRGRGRPAAGTQKRDKLIAIAVTTQEFERFNLRAATMNRTRSDHGRIIIWPELQP